jgi:hypothetical protein
MRMEYVHFQITSNESAPCISFHAPAKMSLFDDKEHEY